MSTDTTDTTSIDPSTVDAIASLFCAGVDWTTPGLCESEAHRALKDGQSTRAALTAVRGIRSRTSPATGYPAETIRSWRDAAPQATRDASSAALAKRWTGLANEPAAVVRAMLATGALEVALGATPRIAGQIAASAATLHARWPDWVWYPSLGLCKILAPALHHDAFSDTDVLILLAWLSAAVDREWQGERDWDEVMFGINGHNYFVTGFGGLATAGTLFPELRSCARFRGFAGPFVETHTLQLFAPDGFTRERSGYHWGTVEELTSVAHLARINGFNFSPAVERRLAECQKASGWKLVTPDGGVPCNGDTSAGHNPGGGGNLRVAAVLADDPVSKFVAEALNPHWQPPLPGLFPHHGADLLPAYQRLAAAPPPGPAGGADTSLPDSGYYVMRSEWSPRSDYCLIDAGARGNVVTSHDHSALFNLELFAHGSPVLLDNCSGHYGWGPDRQWRKSSQSHNVATVDNEPHVPPQSEWRWAGGVQPVVDAWLTDDRYAYFSGAHEAYARLEKPVACRRKLFHLRGGYWILIDRFNTAKDATHTYRQHFNPRAGATLLDASRVITTGAAPTGPKPSGNLLIVPVPGLAGSAELLPNPHPLEGYDNPDTLTYSHTATGNTLLATLLVPFVDDAVPRVAATPLPVKCAGEAVTPFEVTALEVIVNGVRGVYVDQHMYWTLPWSAGGFEGDARVFHSAQT